MIRRVIYCLPLKLPTSKTDILRWWKIKSHWLLMGCLWIETKDVTKAFSSVFQYCQSQRDFISLLIEVTVWNDVRELYVKSSSLLLTVETVKYMFIVDFRPHVWLLYRSTGLTMVLQSFIRTCSLILIFLIQVLFRLWKAVVESCFLRSMSSWLLFNEPSFFGLRHHSFFFLPFFRTVCSVFDHRSINWE